MNSNTEWKFGCVAIAIFVIGFFAWIGPSRCSRYVDSWSADAYGSDWLIVQYSQDGGIINHWELKGKSIGSEKNSDGIFFTENNGNVVHLSGHYIYVQIKDSMEKVKKKYVYMRNEEENE